MMSLFFNALSRFVIAFLSGSNRLLILGLQSPSTVILEPRKIKSVPVSIFFPFCLPWSDESRYHDLSFFNVEFKPGFSLSSFTFIKRLFSASSFSVPLASGNCQNVSLHFPGRANTLMAQDFQELRSPLSPLRPHLTCQFLIIFSVF